MEPAAIDRFLSRFLDRRKNEVDTYGARNTGSLVKEENTGTGSGCKEITHFHARVSVT